MNILEITADRFDLRNLTHPKIAKRAAAELDYSWDWEQWLADDEIVEFEVFAPTAGDELVIHSCAEQDGVVVAFVRGGRLGATYQVTCRVRTLGGRTDRRSIYLKIR